MDYRYIETPTGLRYNINWCENACLKFPEDSKEYAYFFKIWMRLVRKASTLNYEGSVFKV